MTAVGSGFAPATMAELLALLPPGARVLDLGCGKGSFAYSEFANLAIDALDEYEAPEEAFPAHVCYQQGRAEALPYPAAAFDLIIANFVLEHVADFPAAIDEVARVLRAGGSFYMAVPNARSFEDALYRGIYAGGGHLQRHSFESVLATVYRQTELKLISYVEWPGGFTFLEDREGLRALTARMVEACREALGVDIRERSNYLFVFQRQQGLGRPIFTAVCRYCGSGTTDDGAPGQEWTCRSCGRHNRLYSAAETTDDRLEADMQALWERYPFLRPKATPASPAAPPPGDRASAKRRVRLALRMLRRGRWE